MNRDEVWSLFVAKNPWADESPDFITCFHAGWGGHEESLKQTDFLLEPAVVAAPSVTAEMIYQAFPRKMKPAIAKKAIEKAMKRHSAAFLLERTNTYAKCVAEWPKEKREFIPYTATWFNAESFLEDQQDWVQYSGVQKSQFSRSY